VDERKRHLPNYDRPLPSHLHRKPQHADDGSQPQLLLSSLNTPQVRHLVEGSATAFLDPAPSRKRSYQKRAATASLGAAAVDGSGSRGGLGDLGVHHAAIFKRD
jgi:hypothetical protein